MKGILKIEKTSKGKIIHKVEFTNKKGSPQSLVVHGPEQKYGQGTPEGAEVEFDLENGAVVKNCRLPGQKVQPQAPKPVPKPQAYSNVVVGTAPYNFAPYVPGLIVPPMEGKRQWSGKIVCRLTALTPLLVARGEDRGEASGVPRKFLTKNGTPVIPGTSIKGMLRSLMEILSFSGLRPMDRNKFFWRHVTGKAGKSSKLGNEYKKGMPDSPLGGYVTQEGADFFMVKAGEVTRKAPDDPHNWRQVKVNWLPSKDKNGVPIPRPPEGKTIYYFKKPVPDAEKILLDREVWLRFKRQMTDKQKGDYYKKQERMLHGAGMPVFYRQEMGPAGKMRVAELGFCRYFRREYKYSAWDLAWPEKTQEEALDIAEDIFGHVRENREHKLKPKAGRIAVCACFLEGRERPEPVKAVLASPKPTCVPFYLEQNPEKVETQSSKNSGKKNDLESMQNYNDKDARLRGHKLYWHHDLPPEKGLPQGNDNDKVKSVLCPLEKDATGTFTIHVRGLADYELGCLFEALELLPGCHHKLGAGKPLGMGSVKLEIVDAALQKDGVKYSSLAARLQNPKGPGMGDDERAALRKMFREAIYNQVVSAFARENPADYYALPPIKALYVLLDWKNRPDSEEVKNLPLTSKTGGTTFRDNPLLPDPSYVVRKSGG